MIICSVTCADNLYEAIMMARIIRNNRPYRGYGLGNISDVCVSKSRNGDQGP